MAVVFVYMGTQAYRLRYDLVVFWYRHKLARCSTYDEAAKWQKRLWEEPGRQERWAAAMRQFMAGDSTMADLWMMNGRYTDDEATYSGQFLIEAKRRPAICRAMVHMRRASANEPTSVDLIEEFQSLIESPYRTDPDGTVEYRSPLEYTKFTRVLCWLTGRDELCDSLNSENWRDVYARWVDWYQDNCQFLWFDPDEDRYFVDERAKAIGTPRDRSDRLAPPAATPLPHWRGVLP